MKFNSHLISLLIKAAFEAATLIIVICRVHLFAATLDQTIEKIRADRSGSGSLILIGHIKDNATEKNRVLEYASLDKNPIVRIAAVGAIGELKISCTEGAMIANRGLNDENKFVRTTAANYFSTMKCKSDELLEAIDLEKDEQVLRHIISAAAETKHELAISHLLKIQNDRDRTKLLRLTAARGIATLNSDPDYTLIENSIKSGSANEREMAFKAASYTSNKKLLDVISRFTQGNDENSGYALIAQSGIQINALSHQSEKIAYLISLFTHQNKKLRSWVFYTALTEHGTPEVERQIRQIAGNANEPFHQDALTGLLLSGKISMEDVREIESGYPQ